MFLGHYRHGVDGKGRVAVPAAFRRGLAEGSVIAIGPEQRLVIRDPQSWKEFSGTYTLRADSPDLERRYLRALYASAREVELDGQGRILLTDDHRRWARIAERAVFVGMDHVVEIVGEQIWDAEQAEIDPQAFTKLNDSLARPAAPTARGGAA